jgi:ankyrin repeat protein
VRDKARFWLLAASVAALAVAGRAAATVNDAALRNLDMIAAAGRGDVTEVKRLLDAGASPRFADPRGVTALIAAAYGNHLWAARLLIEAKADVNAQDATRQSAFLIAASEGYVELLKLTIAAGADARRTDSYDGTALIRAADRGHVEIVRELLQTTDVPIDHVNRLGWSPGTPRSCACSCPPGRTSIGPTPPG